MRHLTFAYFILTLVVFCYRELLEGVASELYEVLQAFRIALINDKAFEAVEFLLVLFAQFLLPKHHLLEQSFELR